MVLPKPFYVSAQTFGDPSIFYINKYESFTSLGSEMNIEIVLLLPNRKCRLRHFSPFCFTIFIMVRVAFLKKMKHVKKGK